jgi:very-short-patch-repair endonuclease
VELKDDPKVVEAFRMAENIVIREAVSSLEQEIASQDEMTPIEQIMWLSFYHMMNSPVVKIEPQARVGKYRVDFLLRIGTESIIVECDGHNFHERTKEQAAKDRKRDRDLQSDGFKVMRFTGSEIWNDADSCYREVEREIIKAIMKTKTSNAISKS